MILVVVTMVISITFVLISGVLKWQQANKVGYSHLMLALWTLIQIPFVIIIYELRSVKPMVDKSS